MFPFTITFSRSFKGLLTDEKREAIVLSITELLCDNGVSEIVAIYDRIIYKRGRYHGRAFSLPGYFLINEDQWTFEIKLKLVFYWDLLLTIVVLASAALITNIGFAIAVCCLITIGHWISILEHRQRFFSLMAGIDDYLKSNIDN